jgi:phosphatidylserine/phosphatidylglycerophosphate/cardiolipin synthase-like enzyme
MRSLANVPSSELHALHHALAAGRLVCPLRATALQAEGLGTHAAALQAALGDLDRTAVLGVIDAVLAERTQQASPRVHLVWTGPEARRATARDTAVVLRELFESARASVLIAGYSFDHGRDLFYPLRNAMTTHGVSVRAFVHIGRTADDPEDPDVCARSFAENFFRDLWPWKNPRPELFYDPRTVSAHLTGEYASLHAKCVVVDGLRTLIGSANFTNRAQTRNVEAGVLIEDRRLATNLLDQFGGLVRAGDFQRVPEP